MSTYLITGVCGFIGCNLALRLLRNGHRVLGVDRTSGGRNTQASKQLRNYENFVLYDNIDLFFDFCDEIEKEPIDMIFHLAANADIRFSSKYPHKDLNDGIIATYNVLRFALERGIKKIAYSSTAAIYGDPEVIPTPENYAPIQTSFYGASKMAGEALIQAHCSSYDAQAWIFRYASITGPRYSHGFIYNFYRSLKNNPNELFVHGGKEQVKTYLDVDDCIEAMLTIIQKADERVNIFNIGHFQGFTLRDSIPIICKYMNINPTITWSGNEVGWIGDSKINILDISKLVSLGWKPKYTTEHTIIRTLDWLEANQWILQFRKEL